MISIFSKKRFLVDYLEDFVDIHNHLLPGIDDGAKSVEESLSLIKGMGELGITRFIATPHIMHNYYPNTPETINSALGELRNAMAEHKLTDVTINAAAEHMIDDNFEQLLEEDGIMPLKQDYLLIEMSFLQASINLDTAIEKTKQKGYFPILAHPERYVYFKNKQEIFASLKKKDVSLQLNLLSLGEYYGIETHKLARDLLENERIDFLASDLHHSGHLKELKKIQLTETVLERLFPILENTIAQFY